MSRTLPRLLYLTVAASLTVGCDTDDQYTLQSLPAPEPSTEVVALMNPFTLKYGSVVQLPPESPTRPDSWRGPTDRFAVPLSIEAELPMFVDFDITTIPPDGIVYASSARRVYPDSISCLKVREELSQIVERKIPNLAETELGYENDELGVYVDCSRNPGSRFIGLDLQIFHKKSRSLIDLPDEIKAQFED